MLSLKLSTSGPKAAETKIALLKVVNVMKLWIETQSCANLHDPSVEQTLRSIAQDSIQPVLESAASNLVNYLQNHLEKGDSILAQEQMQFDSSPPKTKKLPKHIKSPSEILMEDLNPLEFARQMALVDHHLFRAIQPGELLHMNWTKSNKELTSPNILRMIKQFNSVGQWVITQLLSAHKANQKVKELSCLIEIAFESLRLQNYNGAMAMVSGLKSSTVSKMKETWVRTSHTSGLGSIVLTFLVIE